MFVVGKGIVECVSLVFGHYWSIGSLSRHLIKQRVSHTRNNVSEIFLETVAETLFGFVYAKIVDDLFFLNHMVLLSEEETVVVVRYDAHQ